MSNGSISSAASSSSSPSSYLSRRPRASRRDSLDRRSTVWQSLQSLDNNNNENDNPARMPATAPVSPLSSSSSCSNSTSSQENPSNKNTIPRRARYERRGSVTRYQMEAPSQKIQPSKQHDEQEQQRPPRIPCRRFSTNATPSLRVLQFRQRAASFTTRSSTSSRDDGAQVTTGTTCSAEDRALYGYGDDQNDTASSSNTYGSRGDYSSTTKPSSSSARTILERKYHRRGSVTKYSLSTGSNHDKNNTSNTNDDSLLQPSDHSCSMKRRTVQFDAVQIYEFPIILGDNPSVKSGAPVMLGWNCTKQYHHTVNMYETYHRHGSIEDGRSVQTIPVQERAQWLLQAGFSIYEIGDAALEVDTIKKQRLETLQSVRKNRSLLPAAFRGEQMAEFMETASRALKRIVVPEAKPTFVTAKTA